ncbi:papain family cysteine protease (macronuclear) [Tetrahymena thermophila SB210]|uniref:Papain family cysteine protease n=1 Tax=Tetrahymena thermophila (strain SB210) TaxID=312017 RepID=I7MCX6_TETTS|nr:papain family cysteine protease [Tetrahymena thermophila SB210]EAR85108.1 papain family cysteine protease [Tetrahymena thermophila SB210]|eukprot:XP_001032771.1 papain family cysteine protease [Tetrahymena thermophila SB210]
MRTQLLIAAALGLTLLGLTSYLFLHKSTQVGYTDDQINMWKGFKKTYNKKFSSEDADQEAYRMNVFFDNVEYASQDSTMGITKFMDLTPVEFAQLYLNPIENVEGSIETFQAIQANGDIVVDWVAKGAVTPVKDQGGCGGCWSFATTGGVEGANFVYKNVLPNLSEQQLIDCDTQNSGCGGGLRDVALNYVKATGLATEQDYPYEAKDGKCRLEGKSHPWTVSGYTSIKQCADLVTAIQKAPVTVGIDASNLQFYTGGIFSKCATNINHGVLLVGYDSVNQSWKVKNSWGPNFGEHGYFQLSAKVTGDQIANTCGICSRAYAPYI